MTNDKKESNKLGECIVVDQLTLQQHTSSQTSQLSKNSVLIQEIQAKSLYFALVLKQWQCYQQIKKKSVAKVTKLIFSFSPGSIVTFLKPILTSMILADVID